MSFSTSGTSHSDSKLSTRLTPYFYPRSPGEFYLSLDHVDVGPFRSHYRGYFLCRRVCRVCLGGSSGCPPVYT